MKKVLLTNRSMINYAGSELDTITMANYFLDHNYEVSILTMEYGYPLLKEIDDKIKLYDSSSVDLIDNHFDLIWAHHFPLLDYLLFNKKISVDYICYVSLSSYMGYEAFPVYYKDLNYLGIVSKEAFDLAISEGYDTSEINVFSNYSFEKYFKKNIKLKNKIENICVVSNHVPEEIVDMKSVFSSNNINVDIYGIGYKVEQVDDKLLEKYDVIVSIGKTINYGLSLGIPCYCYDRFGGDGYIMLDNIEKSYEYNFSGRYKRIKKGGKELYDDIIKNYKKVIKDVKEVKKWALDNFCYEKNMEKVLEKIYSTPKFDVNELLEKYPTEIRKAPLLFEVVAEKNEFIKNIFDSIKYCQFYYDFGNGFNEKDSDKKYYTYFDNNNYYVKVKIPDNVKKIRFDYSEKILTKVNSIEINKKAISLDNLINTVNYNGSYISINNDPSIVIDTKDKELEIKVNMEFLNAENMFSDCLNDIKSLKMTIEEINAKRLKNRIKNIFKRKNK